MYKIKTSSEIINYCNSNFKLGDMLFDEAQDFKNKRNLKPTKAYETWVNFDKISISYKSIDPNGDAVDVVVPFVNTKIQIYF